jgi:hypothetical protein
VTNRSLKISRKMNISFILLCKFSFLWGPSCKMTGVMH